VLPGRPWAPLMQDAGCDWPGIPLLGNSVNCNWPRLLVTQSHGAPPLKRHTRLDTISTRAMGPAFRSLGVAENRPSLRSDGS
jgi:hypothetical protein